MNIDIMQPYSLQKRPFQHVEQQLSHFQPIHLDEMHGVSLLNRIDTKYLMPLTTLHNVLMGVQDEYRVLDINHIRLNRYHTVYYDTPDFMLYNQHHNAVSNRYKVRTRQYVDSELAFFEVKHKTNRDRTIKSRLPVDEVDHQDIAEFLDNHVPVDVAQLEPKLYNDYLRFTLVSYTRPERVTVDVNLSFSWGDLYTDLPGLAIAEVKQEHFSANSDFIQALRPYGVRQSPFSKYCAGVYMLYDDVKINNFKPRMRQVAKVMQQEAQHVFAL